MIPDTVVVVTNTPDGGALRLLLPALIGAATALAGVAINQSSARKTQVAQQTHDLQLKKIDSKLQAASVRRAERRDHYSSFLAAADAAVLLPIMVPRDSPEWAERWIAAIHETANRLQVIRLVGSPEADAAANALLKVILEPHDETDAEESKPVRDARAAFIAVAQRELAADADPGAD